LGKKRSTGGSHGRGQMPGKNGSNKGPGRKKKKEVRVRVSGEGGRVGPRGQGESAARGPRPPAKACKPNGGPLMDLKPII